MTITAGLSGLNAAVSMMRNLRDLAGTGQLKPEEIPFRISEIYDYIVDSKDALIDARDEISSLKAQLESLKRDREVFLEGGVNWEKRPDGMYDGPLCPVCWGLLSKRVPMEKDERYNHPDHVAYDCLQHRDAPVARRVTNTVIAKYVR